MLSAHSSHAKWHLPPLFDPSDETVEHFLRGPDPIHLNQTAGIAIKLDEGLGLRFVQVEPAINGLRGVIVSLDDVSPAVLAGPGFGLDA